MPRRRLDDGAVDQVIDRRRSGQHGAGRDHRTLLDHRAFVDAGIASHQHIVFDDHRQGANRLEHAADLSGGTDMHAGADLRARSDQRVRVDQRAFAHISADVDVHRRHADHAAGDEGAAADGRTTGHNADASCHPRALHRLRILVVERQAGRHLHEVAKAKTEQDALLDPGVDAPSGGHRQVRLRRAHGSRFEGGLQLIEGGARRRLVGA